MCTFYSCGICAELLPDGVALPMWNPTGSMGITNAQKVGDMNQVLASLEVLSEKNFHAGYDLLIFVQRRH